MSNVEKERSIAHGILIIVWYVLSHIWRRYRQQHSIVGDPVIPKYYQDIWHILLWSIRPAEFLHIEEQHKDHRQE